MPQARVASGVAHQQASIASELQRQNEDLISLTATYFNANADRLNKVVTRLSIASTLFIAWTLVTGFFGQNFGWLVGHISTDTAFIIYGIGGLVVPLALLFTWFRLRASARKRSTLRVLPSTRH